MALQNEQQVLDIFEKLRLKCFEDLQAEGAYKLLLKLSSIYANIIELAIDAEMEYNRKYEQCASEVEKITEARAIAKASPEYEKMLRLQGKLEVNKELINSLKYLLKVKIDEARDTKY